MHRLTSFDALSCPAALCAVGTFDGIHLGHAALLGGMVREAREQGLAAVVVTFFPHPKVVFGRAPDRYLTLPDAKADRLAAMGIDALITLPFDAETIATPAATFLARMRAHCGLRGLWMGEDFALGNRREGDAAWLRARGAVEGFDVRIVAPLILDGRPVSATRVREALQRGDVAEAAHCLGRPYAIPVTVLSARALRARERQALPMTGDYAGELDGRPVHLHVHDGWPGAIALAAGERAERTSEETTLIIHHRHDIAS